MSLSISFCCFGERRSIAPPLNVIPVEEMEADWGVEREILWVWLRGRRHFWCSWWGSFSMYSQSFQRRVRSGQLSGQNLSKILYIWAKVYQTSAKSAFWVNSDNLSRLRHLCLTQGKYICNWWNILITTIYDLIKGLWLRRFWCRNSQHVRQ